MASFRALYARTGLPDSAYKLFVAAIHAWEAPREMPALIADIIKRVENDRSVDGELLNMLARMSCEANKEAAQSYEKQLMIAA